MTGVDPQRSDESLQTVLHRPSSTLTCSELSKRGRAKGERTDVPKEALAGSRMPLKSKQ